MTMEAERDGEEQRRPLLPGSGAAEQQYQYLARSSSSVLRGGGGPEVRAEEVRSAASFSSSAGHRPPPAAAPYGDNLYPYPPSIHSAALSPSPSQSPAPASPHSQEGLAIVPQGPCPYGGSYQPSESVGRDVLDEVEIRQLLIDHVGHRCCWGSRPARTWKISSIENCYVYVGTLETFIEERDIVTKKEPYQSGKIDDRDNGPVLGVWELDLRSEFPLLFVREKEVMIKIPHSEVVEKCLDCESRGETPCPVCNAGKEHGFYKANQMIRCSACYGRGLLADEDGSDSVCGMCNGKGMLPCVACGSRGLVTCKTCTGYGSLLAQKNAHVRCTILDITRNTYDQEHVAILRIKEMSRLARDPHPRTTTTTTTKKASSPASAFTSVAAQLLLRRGGREAVNGDSIEFFSDLRKRQPEPVASTKTERGGPARPEDGRGRTRRRGSSAGSDELLASEIGKHDYDWLLTPPATPLWSPAASVSSGHQQVSTTARPNQLPAQVGSASHAKTNPRLGAPSGRDNKENAASRLSRSSSAANTPAGGGHMSHARTLSSASASSINTNASLGSTTMLLSAASSPGTPGTARSAWSAAAATARHRDITAKASTSAAAVAVSRQRQGRPSSSSSSRSSAAGQPMAPATRSRARAAAPSGGVSSPRSTTASTSQQQAQTQTTLVSKRADAAARSRLLASQSSGTSWSTGLHAPSSPTTRPQQTRDDVHPTRGARALPSSSSSSSPSNAAGVKTRSVAAAKQSTAGGVAAASATTQRWRQTLAPAIAAARGARREVGSVDVGSPRNNSAAGRKAIAADKQQAAPQQRPSTAAAGGSGLSRTASRPKSAHTRAPTMTNAAKHGGGGPPQQAHQRKPAAAPSQQWSSRTVSSTRSRLGLTTGTAAQASGSINRGRSLTMPEPAGRVAALAAAAARITATAAPEAFPSTRYDAMLLREDRRNLTWLRGCDEADDGGGGLDLGDDGSLEPFDLRGD